MSSDSSISEPDSPIGDAYGGIGTIGSGTDRRASFGSTGPYQAMESENFITRLKYWSGFRFPGQSMLDTVLKHAQLCVIFECGARITEGGAMKEKMRFARMARLYQDACGDLKKEKFINGKGGTAMAAFGAKL